MKTRRDFLRVAGLCALGASLVKAEDVPKSEEMDVKPLRLGIIGCGGRGLGAALDVLAADRAVQIYALADAFPEAIVAAKQALQARSEHLNLTAAREFSGLDAYEKLLATEVDLVILAAPPVFRPQHAAAAVAAGKHVFLEKPMAVDFAGVCVLVEAAKVAREKRLSVQHGFCWRFSPGMLAAREKSKDLGRLISFYGSFLTTPVKPLPKDATKENFSRVAEQIRWWQNYRWSSGGPLVEQGIHTLDQMSAMLGDMAPVAVVASGGQAQRSGPLDVFDHYNAAFEYPNGVFCHVAERQFTKAFGEIRDRFFFEKGTLIGPENPYLLNSEQKREWAHVARGPEATMYELCQDHWLKSIRAGKPLDSWDLMIHLSKLALMARRAAETGRRVTWEEIAQDREEIAPPVESLQQVREISTPLRIGES